jgi:hypothetical protein
MSANNPIPPELKIHTMDAITTTNPSGESASSHPPTRETDETGTVSSVADMAAPLGHHPP